ncbi:ribosomal RNA small subunit methyltransferase A [candidate division WOR-3 bacterium]|nr:ribosomal RNA small subunit methyltransferase A [candidate division WOR-3 bacterium]
MKFAERIAGVAGVDNELVVEIGSGRGILTRQLAKRAEKVIAVELDRKLACFLEGERISRVDVLNRDFLGLELSDFSAPVIVGNIPYGITSAIIEKLAGSRHQLKRAVFTVQKEYASRMVASPGSPDRGYLSIYANYHFAIAREFTIPARFFSPRPKVNSVVVTLRPKEPVLGEESAKNLFQFIAGVFRYRRKSLKNAIMKHMDWRPCGPLPELFAKRPQHLDFDDFRRIYELVERGI